MLLGDLYTTCCKINTNVELFFPHQNTTTKQRSDENRDERCWVLIVLAEVAFRPICQAVSFSRGLAMQTGKHICFGWLLCVLGECTMEWGNFSSLLKRVFPQLGPLLSQHKDGKRTQNIALLELYSAYWMTEVSVFVVVPPPMYMLYLVLIFDNIASPALSFSSSSGTWTPSSER